MENNEVDTNWVCGNCIGCAFILLVIVFCIVAIIIVV